MDMHASSPQINIGQVPSNIANGLICPHCQGHIKKTFDETKSGNLTVPEFLHYVKFLHLMTWLNAEADLKSQAQGEMRVDELLGFMEANKAEMSLKKK